MAFKHVLSLTGLLSCVLAESTISGVSWGPQRLDILGLDSYDDVFHKYYTAFGWGPDDPKHGNLELHKGARADSPVSAASWAANRLDYVFVDQDGEVQHQYWDGSSWGPGNGDFESLGSGVTGPLSISSWGPDRLDIFGLTELGTYAHKAWTGSEYYPPSDLWEDLGGNFASPPATVSWASGRLDVFGINNEGNISHKFWDGFGWKPSGRKWEDLGGHGFSGTPVASSMHANRFDIWAVSDDSGELYHRFFDGFGYSSWESLGGNFINAPQVVHWGPNRIDLLGKDGGKKSSYQYKYWDGYQWSGWHAKGDDFESEPAIVSIGENNLNLFGIDKAGKLKLQVWDGSQWLPDHKTWYELGNTKFDDDNDSSSSDAVVAPRPGKGEEVIGADDDDNNEQTVRIELKFKA